MKMFQSGCHQFRIHQQKLNNSHNPIGCGPTQLLLPPCRIGTNRTGMPLSRHHRRPPMHPIQETSHTLDPRPPSPPNLQQRYGNALAFSRHSGLWFTMGIGRASGRTRMRTLRQPSGAGAPRLGVGPTREVEHRINVRRRIFVPHFSGDPRAPGRLTRRSWPRSGTDHLPAPCMLEGTAHRHMAGRAGKRAGGWSHMDGDPELHNCR